MDETTQKMMQAVAAEAAKAAVHETLTSLGVDAANPLETQKDMGALREIRLLLRNPEFQQDLAQIRALRTSGNFIRTTAGKTVVTVIVTGLFGMIALGVREYFNLGAAAP